MPTLRLGRYDAGCCMGVTWPVSWKQRQSTASARSCLAPSGLLGLVGRAVPAVLRRTVSP